MTQRLEKNKPFITFYKFGELPFSKDKIYQKKISVELTGTKWLFLCNLEVICKLLKFSKNTEALVMIVSA